VPLEFRGASGALDNEHEHRNLRTRGSHIKTDDLSRDVQPHPMTALTDEQSAALLAGWATARQHAFGRGKSKVVNVRITEASRKVIAERISPRPQVLAPSSVPEFRPLTQRAYGVGVTRGGCHGFMAAFLHGA
jgi:hypothetical protein